MKFIDLSVTLNEETPFYPGDPAIKIEPNAVMQNDGYEDHYVSIGTHVGTHIDAPTHMIKGTKTLDEINIERFIGRGVYIKVEEKRFNIEEVKNADIREDDIVLFHTGMSDVYYDPEYYNSYPAIPLEIAEYLVEKRVKMVGIDCCSVDPEVFPVHKLLLGKEILIIENLTNLKMLAGKEFIVYAFPIKLQLDGAPARVVAKIKS